MYKTFINGEEVLAMTDYEGTHQQREGNVFLLNAAFKDSLFTYPMKARLDVRMLIAECCPVGLRNGRSYLGQLLRLGLRPRLD